MSLHPQSFQNSSTYSIDQKRPWLGCRLVMDNPSLNTAIDLSLRPVNCPKFNNLVRPIPRLPWTITWYQSVWSTSPNNYHHGGNSVDLEKLRDSHIPRFEEDAKFSTSHSGTISPGLEDYAERAQAQQGSEAIIESNTPEKAHDGSPSTLLTAVLDVACCDGPVVFERVSNPNFALTVQHNEPCPIPTTPTIGGELECQTKTSSERRQLDLKTYVCIYCNQSFKSLFCYQKHKKRHLNPVSVDITATHNTTAPSRVHSSDNKSKTKDLNVQFFPCKKCGSKFPSYYFVHKHRKVCHIMDYVS